MVQKRNLARAFILTGSLLAWGCSAVPAASPPSPQDSKPSSTPTRPSTPPSPTATPYQSLLATTDLATPEICEPYRITLDHFTNAAKKKLSSGKKAKKDPYAASAYAAKAKWLTDRSVSSLDESLNVVSTEALNRLTQGRASEATNASDFLSDSLAACGLVDAASSAEALAQQVDDLAADITALAADRPWYPRGFFELTDGLAGKWVDGARDPCGYGPLCWYWTLDVVAKDGCPSGLYLEANLLDGGTVVDWTNDSVPALAQGEKARMQFWTYNRGVDDLSLAKASCL